MMNWEDFFSDTQLTCGPAEQTIEKLENDVFNRGLISETLSATSALPNKSAARRTFPFKKRQNSNPSKPFILLIDDDETFRKMLRRYLETAGYEVVEAADGSIGVTLYAENPTELVITDIIMPEKDGLETIIEIKQINPDVKIIAISGGGSFGTDIDLDMARKLGARTLDKPFELKMLLTVIRELLG